MKNYIFYTNQGFTQDLNENETENCQILGWASGENQNNAFENLKSENKITGFENIMCQELANNSVHIF